MPPTPASSLGLEPERLIALARSYEISDWGGRVYVLILFARYAEALPTFSRSFFPEANQLAHRWLLNEIMHAASTRRCRSFKKHPKEAGKPTCRSNLELEGLRYESCVQHGHWSAQRVVP